MVREVLLTPNLQDEETWSDFANIIDEVWSYNVDNALKVFPTLRDTYSFTETIFSLEDEARYISEIPLNTGANNYTVRDINFLDTNFTTLIIKTTNSIPSQVNNNNLQPSTRLIRGGGANGYVVNSEFTFSLITPLAPNESLQVISYRQNTFDLTSLYNYGNGVQAGVFQLDFPNDYELNINTAINLETGLPANLTTGFPYNLLIVYLKIADGSYQYLPQSSYRITGVNTIEFLVLPYNPLDPSNPGQYLISEFRIVMRQPAVEVTKKLNQLGFNYNNIEYVTRPSFVDNAHIIQAMADNYSHYLFNTSGTPRFMDFFQYCSNSSFELYKLWAQDNGDLTIYDNLTRETLLPLNFSKVYEVAEGSGGWYPTSHVDLFYDIFTYGSYVDPDEVRKFFDYVSPINLVLNTIVFGGSVPPSAESTIFIGGGAEIKIKYV